MTEQEWTTASDPQMLLEFLGEKVSGRKVRLFAIACCRTIGALLGSSQQYALNVAERYADRAATDQELKDALLGVLHNQGSSARVGLESVEGQIIQSIHAALYSDTIQEWYLHPERAFGDSPLVPYAPEAFQVPFAYALYCSIHVAHAVARSTHANERTSGPQEELLRQVFRLHADFLRDIVGNPFQDSAVSIADIVRSNPRLRLLAAHIYLNSSFFEVPLLARLLVENGLRPSLLREQMEPESHHVKGCWVVDQVLGLD